MASWGEIQGGFVVDTLKCDAAFIAATQPNPQDWMELPYGVAIGWAYDGQDFTGPSGESPPAEPAPVIKYRTVLTSYEWFYLFTEAEWNWIKTKRQTIARLDDLLIAIQTAAAVDIIHTNMDEFYAYLLAQGIPGGQTRIDELRQGVPE